MSQEEGGLDGQTTGYGKVGFEAAKANLNLQANLSSGLGLTSNTVSNFGNCTRFASGFEFLDDGSSAVVCSSDQGLDGSPRQKTTDL